MCGIFGILPQKLENKGTASKILTDLLKLSESRGHDASGIAVYSDQEIKVYKRSLPAKKLIQTQEYKKLVQNDFSKSLAIIGHARMETNGSFYNPSNNQPVVKDGCVTIHNGIIVNDIELWQQFPGIKKEFDVDTEIINSLLTYFVKKEKDISIASECTFKHLIGSYSTATIFDNIPSLLLATNTGSMYLVKNQEGNVIMFASEKHFLEKILDKYFPKYSFTIHQMSPLTTLLINFGVSDKPKKIYNINTPNGNLKINCKSIYETNHRNFEKLKEIVSIEYETNIKRINELKRCTKCILPETTPFIEFGEHGVCNYCSNYTKMEVLGKEELEKIIEPLRVIKQPNCIVAFSGGRDSSYGLSYIKENLGLIPVAYSYDWGMLTDLGRRNQARMTGTLGVEHILISADIQKKRENIRKNVEAWLKRPNLGTVPLFMAGDKQYFYYANMLRKQMGIDLVILCENFLEKTDFKSGFCGIKPKKLGKDKFYSLPLLSTLKMSLYYLKEFLFNPSYINSSLLDTIWAFQSYYFMPHKLLSFYKYVRWDEKIVENKLRDFDWEVADDTPTTWRIGDGTAAFYNYIYYTMAGLSENDTFRSNQVREGDMTREEALQTAARDNKPRVDSLLWYANTVGFDIVKAVGIINNAKKQY